MCLELACFDECFFIGTNTAICSAVCFLCNSVLSRHNKSIHCAFAEIQFLHILIPPIQFQILTLFSWLLQTVTAIPQSILLICVLSRSLSKVFLFIDSLPFYVLLHFFCNPRSFYKPTTNQGLLSYSHRSDPSTIISLWSATHGVISLLSFR